MVSEEESKQSPGNPRPPPLEQDESTMFSPGFRSVAAMAGWDEEALLIASLVVEDTPDRQFKQNKRTDLQFKSPPTNSRRKRRAQRRSPVSIHVTVLNLDEDEPARDESEKQKTESKTHAIEEKNTNDESNAEDSGGVSCSSASAIPCMDRLREELSCAICLEICFEPSTTPCGHSFCKKCLRSAADKCGKKCPKCRQLISNARSCTVNTVLWNTIQLLFPQEIEARKAAGALNSREAKRSSPARVSHSNNVRNRSVQALISNSPEDENRVLGRRRTYHGTRNRTIVRPSGGDSGGVRRRREVASQDVDAALALRLQREEFMEAFRGDEQNRSNSVSLARANLRAMASRAINIRIRGRPM